MDKKAVGLINKAVENILTKADSEAAVKKLDARHTKKIHFIPKSYRVFGGTLQSMNIQFGNFIEELMSLLIASEKDYEIVSEYSGKRSRSFTLSASNSNKINAYIDQCRLRA